MIKVHHLENSRSQRVLWCLEELEVEYEVVTYQRDPVTMRAPDSLRAVHPLGKSPVISDEAHPGRVVAESGAIMEYLVERFDGEGRLIPPAGSDERLRYRFWLHHAEGSAMPPLIMRLVFAQLGKPPVPAPARPLGRLFANGVEKQFLEPEIRGLLDYWESELKHSTWFAGDTFSAADIQMSFPVLALESGRGLSGYPKLSDFLVRCRARGAYQRAVAQGGEFSMG
ncbi:glutathione S-transferase [Halomonas sp. TRM85114]|uniref:glutathione S-transferase n=1 Tax=Halomonas jincaotanensis TaxID=2810616 RepID=UPI001BD26C60|nr:glutathione S-transferase [Halomonas jincaotanensis]MBS9402395.1 glutathione S-transferase [Halomonas jincaotanensis]